MSSEAEASAEIMKENAVPPADLSTKETVASAAAAAQ